MRCSSGCAGFSWTDFTTEVAEITESGSQNHVDGNVVAANKPALSEVEWAASRRSPVEAAVSAAILQHVHATRVLLQEDAQATRLPLRHRPAVVTELTSEARLDITRRVERQRSA